MGVLLSFFKLKLPKFQVGVLLSFSTAYCNLIKHPEVQVGVLLRLNTPKFQVGVLLSWCPCKKPYQP